MGAKQPFTEIAGVRGGHTTSLCHPVNPCENRSSDKLGEDRFIRNPGERAPWSPGRLTVAPSPLRRRGKSTTSPPQHMNTVFFTRIPYQLR